MAPAEAGDESIGLNALQFRFVDVLISVLTTKIREEPYQ